MQTLVDVAPSWGSPFWIYYGFLARDSYELPLERLYIGVCGYIQALFGPCLEVGGMALGIALLSARRRAQVLKESQSSDFAASMLASAP